MRILISETDIRVRLEELGRELTATYRNRPLTVVGVLTGSLIFLADLMRKLDVPHQVGFLQASSYRAGTTAGDLAVNREYFPEIRDRDVLLIDDIFDTGHTLHELLNKMQALGPKSIRSAVLLRKRGRQEMTREPDHAAFMIPDEFVVGYGLDYNDAYRNLPYIAALEAEEIAAGKST